MKLDLNNLPRNFDFLHHMIVDLVRENECLKTEKIGLVQVNEELHSKNEYLEHQLILLRAKRFGKASEKLDTAKLDEQIADIEERIEDSEIAVDPLAKEEATEEIEKEESDVVGTTPQSTKPKNQPKRKPLPAHLPREDNMINPDPVCPGCGGMEFRKISDDVSETLEYVPSSFKVIRNIRPRCACKNCEQIVQGFAPSSAISKGKAGSGLLAHILVQKYCNHLPFYRQSQIYGYEDIDLPRSTMASWAGRCARLLEPLIDEIKKAIFASPQIHGDDTIVKVLAPGLGRTKTGRIWSYVRDGRPHGDLETPPAICYFYSPDRKGERPQEHLKDYKGVFHADAYAGYDKIYGEDITEAACWAHTRRKFYEIIQTTPKASIAYESLEKIGEMYKIEEEIRGLKPDKRREVRQKQSRELVEKLFASWKKYYALLPKKSPTAGAIAYALNLEVALKRFLDNGKIEIDNNAAERAMRGWALGRKNWLFAGSDTGGETAAAMYTIIETAKLNDINPWKYLRYVLDVIQDHNARAIAELLPWNVNLT
jgi:transposase